MYINLGEDKLCEICTLHPRFRNFLTDRVEIGLGLCCEEAVRIILSNKDKTFFTIDKEENENLNSDEEEILSLRSEIIDILQNRKENILDRFLNAFSLFDNCVLPERNIKYWAEKFSELESLDDKWADILYKLQNYDFENDFEKVLLKYETEFEQLSVYFIYRHFIKAVDDFCEKEYLQFAFLSVYMISSIFSIVEPT